MSARKQAGKRQSNILSFFGKSPRAAGTPSSKPAKGKTSPVSAARAKTVESPSTEPKLVPSVRRTGASAVGARIAADPEIIRRDLSRELFEEPCNSVSVRHGSTRKRALSQGGEQSKRFRRIVRIADSDDDDDEDYVMDVDEEEEEPVQTSQLSVEDVDMSTNTDSSSALDLSIMSCPSRNEESSKGSANPLKLPAALEQDRQGIRERLSAYDINGVAAGEEEGGWCEKHSWSKDIRDSKMRRPTDEGYDKTTLYIPKSEFRPSKQGGMSPFQQQYWKIKMNNYDTVVFMKKGKFYELYDVDADIGHNMLGLCYTKGGRVNMRCSGIPEQSFEKHSVRLLNLGYKVGRIEQVETNNSKEMRKGRSSGGNSAACIDRKLARIVTKATVMDEAMLHDHRPRYVFAIAEDIEHLDESQSNVDSRITVGVCYVDTACGSVTLREFSDDFRRSETERTVSVLKPQELLLSRRCVSNVTSKLLNLSADRSGATILQLFEDGMPEMTPAWLAVYLDSKNTRETHERVSSYISNKPLAKRAFGAIAKYFQGLMIDTEVFSLGNFTLKEDNASRQTTKTHQSPSTAVAMVQSSTSVADVAPRDVRMDASTLASLEVLTSIVDGSEKNSLLSVIDHARTPRGRRLLKKWMSMPLVRSIDIEERLNAVDTLLEVNSKDDGFVLMGISKKLSSGKDIERALSQLHSQVVNNQVAVMYDDTNKRKVKKFVKILQTLENTLDALEEANEVLQSVECKSERLSWLGRAGCGVPTDARKHLSYFFNDAFDLNAAESTGDVIPKEGAAPDYDYRKRDLDLVEQELNEELSNIKRTLGVRNVKFYHRCSEKFQAEVDVRSLERSLPSEFELVSQNKSVKRFYTPALKRLIKKNDVANEAFELAAKQVVREIISQFLQHFEVWSTLSKSSAELDALIGLSRASMGDGSGPMCRPTVLPNSHPVPVFHAKQLRHPVLASKSSSFIPNDVNLGDSEPNLAILTGPNAGGKSTLSRQVAACALLAQVGCYVTAESLTFRPFEDVFVRMGANDDIVKGQSTFMVEMEDVSNILNNATSHSLVIADEVGRGTSTHDGYAIAYGALVHLAKKSNCLGVFSTHYTMLGRDIAAESDQNGRQNVGVYEMAASVDEEKKQVTFLYKFQKGVSLGSRGICCARLAGIPNGVADEAEVAAADFERTLAAKLDACSIRELVRDATDDEALLRVLDSM